MNVYVPILVLGAIAAAFAVGSVGIAVLIGPKRYNRAKLDADARFFSAGSGHFSPRKSKVSAVITSP